MNILTPQKKKHYVVSGYDRKRNEIIVKLINAEAEDWNVQLQLDNAKEIASKGTKIVLGADDRFAENASVLHLRLFRKFPNYQALPAHSKLTAKPFFDNF